MGITSLCKGQELVLLLFSHTVWLFWPFAVLFTVLFRIVPYIWPAAFIADPVRQGYRNQPVRWDQLVPAFRRSLI